ncbi:MAG: hypothetical protein RLZZ458_111, partial [Planctomycetota bacterium]
MKPWPPGLPEKNGGNIAVVEAKSEQPGAE